MATFKDVVVLAVYTRDNAGLIQFRGLEEWDSVEAFSRNASCLGKCEVRTEKMLGWPDDEVHWLIGTSCAGDTGYNIRHHIQEILWSQPERAQELLAREPRPGQHMRGQQA